MPAQAPTSHKFRVGDKAVYPAHGVGVIERIENKEISGSILSFYVIRIIDSDVTVMIPTNNIQTAGLREIIPPGKVNQVFKIFAKKDVVIDTTTWNRRYREYMEKIKTGSVFEIAEVMRDLYVLKKTKTLSFGERKMLDTARNLLIKELALAKSVSEEDIERNIRKIFEE
jgi:CarD family transcriptional regulator